MSSRVLIATVLACGLGVLAGPTTQAEATGPQFVGGSLQLTPVNPCVAARVIIAGLDHEHVEQSKCDDGCRRAVRHRRHPNWQIQAVSHAKRLSAVGETVSVGLWKRLDCSRSTSDASIEHADFALQRMAVISGTITDERGEPVAGVLVFVMRPVYLDGRRQLAPQPSSAGFDVRTDDTGHYRVSALVPGSYVVMATSRDTWTVHKGGGERW